MVANFIKDRGGTRSGVERRKRQFIYMQRDRRCGQDRRSDNDRRQGLGRHKVVDQRNILKSRAAGRSTDMGSKDI